MKRPVILIISVVVILGALAWWWVGSHRRSATTYATAPVERGDLQSTVAATGTVNPVTSVQVVSQVSGRVQVLYADFNSHVRKGQLIAEIDPSLLQSQVDQSQAGLEESLAAQAAAAAQAAQAAAGVRDAQSGVLAANAGMDKAKAALADAKRTQKRQAELSTKNLIARSDLDAANLALDNARAGIGSAAAQIDSSKAKIRTAQAQEASAAASAASARAQISRAQASLLQANTNLSYTKIYAPVEGIVISRSVDVGQTVAASFQAPVLFVIAQDLRQMQINANIDEADVGRVQVGQEVSFTVDAFPDHTYAGTLRQVRNNPVTVQNVVTYDALIRVNNQDLSLRPGMTANLSIVTSKRTGVLKVPNAALRFRPSSGQAGGQTAAPAASPSRRSSGGGNGASGRSRGSSAGGNGGAGAPSGRGHPADVWTLSPKGEPSPVHIQIGISDGSDTEVVSGPLAVGDQIIIGQADQGSGRSPGQSSGQSRGSSPARMFR